MQLNLLNPCRGRFLHIVPDDKFIDAARGIFEEVIQDAHDYMLISNLPLRYIRSFEPVRFEIDEVLKSDILESLSAYSGVFVHFLTNQARLVVAAAPITTKFIWLGWGADFYHLISPHKDLYLPRTLALINDDDSYESSTRKNNLALSSRRLHALAKPSKFLRLLAAHRRLSQIGVGAPREMMLVNRFSAIATPIIEDFEAVCLHNPDFRVPFLDWNYLVEGFSEHGGSDSPTGNDILLGNSATPENNHLDALHVLSQCLPFGRNIICPLSYGNKKYGDVIAHHGKLLFGDRFIALREYMPSAEYLRIIGGCSVVIMNHIRQQALGNIIVALCSGACVFLNPRSPINRTMKRMGIKTHTTDALASYFSVTESKTPLANLQTTRQKIESHYGRESILRRTRSMLDALRN